MTRTVVSGYASLDRAMRVPGHAGPDRTAVVERRLSDPWPAPGGVAHVARAAAGAGAAVSLVSWVGGDDDGRRYLEHLEGDGIDVSAVDTSATRSPTSYLFYDHDGRAACYFDPGDTAETLVPAQRRLLDGTDWWCLTVGPAAVTDDVLRSVPAHCRLAWIVKADAEAFPPEAVARIVRRADVVVFSDGERDFLDAARSGGGVFDLARDDALLVETRGSRAVHYRVGDILDEVDVEPLDVRDTTGAGDTLAGAMIAALAGGDPPETAVRRGVAAARDFLQARTEGSG